MDGDITTRSVRRSGGDRPGGGGVGRAAFLLHARRANPGLRRGRAGVSAAKPRSTLGWGCHHLRHLRNRRTAALSPDDPGNSSKPSRRTCHLRAWFSLTCRRHPRGRSSAPSIKASGRSFPPSTTSCATILPTRKRAARPGGSAPATSSSSRRSPGSARKPTRRHRPSGSGARWPCPAHAG